MTNNSHTVLVTGANTGIGYATALGLAQRGSEVVMLCRSRERGEAARARIVAESGNEAVHLLIADLASQRQIREAADAFKARFGRLDVLVNNAGVLMGDHTLTEDDIETTFAVNHLAYFLLTHLLLDVLRASGPARVVNVSSGAHKGSRIAFEDVNLTNRYSAYGAYAQSKLANIMFTRALARRLSGSAVTTYSLHPGVVRTQIASRGFHPLALAFRLFGFLFLSPAQGAKTSLYLATAPDVAGESGDYFVREKSVRASPEAYVDEDVERLWLLSEELVGLEEGARLPA